MIHHRLRVYCRKGSARAHPSPYLLPKPLPGRWHPVKAGAQRHREAAWPWRDDGAPAPCPKQQGFPNGHRTAPRFIRSAKSSRFRSVWPRL